MKSPRLSFDDVLLEPQYSEVVPADADASAQLAGFNLKVPILSAAMDTVTESDMLVAMTRAGGVGVLHKNLDEQEQLEEILKAREFVEPIVAIAVGVTDWKRRLDICGEFVDMVVVDSAHGHSKNVLDAVAGVKSLANAPKVMAGNVVTPSAVRALADVGADVVKVGVGPGSICTTRLVSGCGVPQFSAVLRCAEEADKRGVQIVADGGVRSSGDMVKALAAGADAVMVGSMLAGTKESPGNIVDGQWKRYRGMGSIDAMERGSKDRYGQSGVSKGKLVPEGVEAMVPYKGSVSDVLYQLVGGIRSGMGYVGARNLSELRSKAKFITVTASGVGESGVHDVRCGVVSMI